MLRATLAAAALSLLAACGSTPPQQQPPPPATSAAPPTSSATSTTTSTSTTSSTPSPTTTSYPFAAADGRNLKACADGACEVFVKSGNVLRINGLGSVSITVADGMVTFTQVGAGGFTSVLSGRPGNTEGINNVTFLIMAVQGGEAAVRVSKG
jgi:predicted small lipoprotein YifL